MTGHTKNPGAFTGLAAYTLAERELRRFARQRNRVVGAFAQPLIFWLLFGAGLSPSFRPAAGGAQVDYLEYFFPGTVVLIVLFTAIFATISVIEDRAEGFLQAVLVAPISSADIVIGKLAGTTVLAMLQAAFLMALAPLAGMRFGIEGVVLALLILVVIAFALAGLGFVIAWRMESTQGFHAIMTAFLMPMWFLSGAFFPVEGVATWLRVIILANPLTYGVAAFRRALYWDRPEIVADLPDMGISLLVLFVFASAMFFLSIRTVRRDLDIPR